MKNVAIKHQATDNLEVLKRLTTVVYICQALAFVLTGVPLLVGVVLNFLNRDAVEGTWLQSPFRLVNKNRLVISGWICFIRVNL
jgi:uncharacterized membrane protein